jgi:antitoxin (DNA-binding transcriptional repressor) of toxin-antitoxin stability system
VSTAEYPQKRSLLSVEMSDRLSDMKTVTLRRLRRESRLLDSAAAGKEIVVTKFGKPYVRILPCKPQPFLGAASHLGVKTPVTSEPIPPSEWKGLY